MPRKKQMSDYERQQVQLLVNRLREIKKDLSRLEEEEVEVKEAILSFYNEYEFEKVSPQSKSSRFTSDNGQSIRITERAGSISVDFKKIYNAIPVEVFLRVFDIKKVELIPGEWEKAVEEELVTDSLLEESINVGEKPNPIIYIE